MQEILQATRASLMHPDMDNERLRHGRRLFEVLS